MVISPFFPGPYSKYITLYTDKYIVLSTGTLLFSSLDSQQIPGLKCMYSLKLRQDVSHGGCHNVHFQQQCAKLAFFLASLLSVGKSQLTKTYCVVDITVNYSVNNIPM